jgi:tetratricopeptide (TPR) repeat protein
MVRAGREVNKVMCMVWYALALVVASGPSPDAVARAKVLYQAGRTHYELGNYSEAIRDFAAGYSLAPRPEFLVNLGQAYRAAGDTEKALEMFEKYLERAPPDAPPRAEVVRLIASLREQPGKVDAPRRLEIAPTTLPTTAAESPAVAPTTPPSKVGWVVAGVGVAVALGVAAVIFGVAMNPVTCAPTRTLGCVDARSP